MLALHQDFAIERELKPKVNVNGKLRDILCKLVQLKHITIGGLGAEPPVARGYGGLGEKPTAT